MDTYVVTDVLTAEDYIAFPDETLKAGMACVTYDEGTFDPGMDMGDMGGMGDVDDMGDMGDMGDMSGMDMPEDGVAVLPDVDDSAAAEG